MLDLWQLSKTFRSNLSFLFSNSIAIIIKIKISESFFDQLINSFFNLQKVISTFYSSKILSIDNFVLSVD